MQNSITGNLRLARAPSAMNCAACEVAYVEVWREAGQTQLSGIIENMRRPVVFVVLGYQLLAQRPSTVPQDLRFEAASLKPSLPGQHAPEMRPLEGGMRYVARNCSIKTMMQGAYRVRAEQIVGGPPWIDTALYDMDAKAEKPSNADELHVMVMNMRVDRVQLKFHRERQEMRIYALTIDHGGPKLTPHEAGNAHDTWSTFQRRSSTPDDDGDKRSPGLFYVPSRAPYGPTCRRLD